MSSDMWPSIHSRGRSDRTAQSFDLTWSRADKVADTQREHAPTLTNIVSRMNVKTASV